MPSDTKFIMKHMETKKDIPLDVFDCVLKITKMEKHTKRKRKRYLMNIYINKSLGRLGTANLILFLPQPMTFFLINCRFPKNKNHTLSHPYDACLAKQVCRLANFLSSSSKPKSLSINIYGFTWCQIGNGDCVKNKILPTIMAIRGVSANVEKFKMFTQRNVSKRIHLSIKKTATRRKASALKKLKCLTKR